jgi:hypothetical protein
MTRRRSLVIVGIGASCFAAAAWWAVAATDPGPRQAVAPAAALSTDGVDAAEDESREGSDFIRFVESDAGAVLEVAVVGYRRDDGASVDLLSAVHVGEKAYYQDLERRFALYEGLLYEMVKDRDLKLDRESLDRRGRNPVSALQLWLKDTLKLEFQLEAIDYTRDNFIHADLDAETFFRLQKERGESILTLMLRAIQADLARQARGGRSSQITLGDMLRIFLSKDRSRAMKRVLARQFEDIEATMAGFEGDKGTVLLTERNKAATRALEETLASGKKRLGIFYGAAHMPDLERRLAGLGFTKASQDWLVAWDMREAEARKSAGGESAGEAVPPAPAASGRRRARF